MMRVGSSPMSGLTEDLVEEILFRVPATSLNRLRYTCKRWNSLINDARFTKKHFDTVEKKYLDLLLRDVRLSSMSVNFNGLHDNIDPCIELKVELSLNSHLYNSANLGTILVFHCNGLLLCIDRSRVVVWNPCTGQTKWIRTKYVDRMYDKYALGYENKKSCRNYKVLRVLSYGRFKMEIYEFTSNSWRVLDRVMDQDFKLQIGGMSVKGNTYWIASGNGKYEDSTKCFLISFDFTRERFGPHLCLPFQGNIPFHFNGDVMSLSSVREERLSVLFQDEVALTIEIWLTNVITETNAITWSVFLRIGLDTHRFHNGATFFINEENKVAVFSEDVSDTDINSNVYIIGQDRWRIVDLEDPPFRAHMFCYVPSLFRI